mmetsp:Transcript_28834/g.73097  ORF Transcript_28834/g.73097 Transcript_28834/m.73097 type:complete len:368 (+) Transcript_28834:1722-2825(+)
MQRPGYVVAVGANSCTRNGWPHIDDVGRAGAVGRLRPRKSDAKQDLPEEAAERRGDELLLLAEPHSARHRDLRRARGTFTVHDAGEQRITVGQLAHADGLDHEAPRLHELLIHERASPSHAAHRFEPADVLHVSSLDGGGEGAPASRRLRIVDVDLAISAVHRLLHEGLVDALATNHNVVLALLEHRLVALVARADHRARCLHTRCHEFAQERPAVLHLDEHVDVVEEDDPIVLHFLSDLLQPAARDAVEEVRPKHQQRVTVRHLEGFTGEVFIREDLNGDVQRGELVQQRSGALEGGACADDEEPHALVAPSVRSCVLGLRAATSPVIRLRPYHGAACRAAWPGGQPSPAASAPPRNPCYLTYTKK